MIPDNGMPYTAARPAPAPQATRIRRSSASRPSLSLIHPDTAAPASRGATSRPSEAPIAMTMICVAACQMVRSTGMRSPATACLIGTGPGPVRCSSHHETPPIRPAAPSVRIRRHQGIVYSAVSRCPSEKLQTRCSITCNRWAQAHPVIPAATPASTTAAIKRRSAEAPAMVGDREVSRFTSLNSRTVIGGQYTDLIRSQNGIDLGDLRRPSPLGDEGEGTVPPSCAGLSTTPHGCG